MLVCPSCHHEVPLPSAAPAITLASSMPRALANSNPPPQLPAVAGSMSSSTEQTAAAKNSACPCDAVPSIMLSQLNPPCHITPTCHASRTCHVTPVCRARAPCHVTPYVCGCALSHSQSSSHDSHASSHSTHVGLSVIYPPPRGCHAVKSCSSSTTTNPSHNAPACFPSESRASVNSSGAMNRNLNGNVSHCHWSSVSETPLTAPCLSGGCETLCIDNSLHSSSKAKLASLGSCPTSPSTPPSKSNTWPSNNISQLNTKESQIENATSAKPCSGNECHGVCASYTLNSMPNVVCTNLSDSHQNSSLSQDASFNYNSCTDSANCNSRIALARQISCPNTNPAAARIVCPCHQQLHHEPRKSLDGMPSDFPFGLFSQCEDAPHFSQHLLSPPITSDSFPAVHSRNSSGHFRIINSTGGGGVVIENQLSRSNSPELKFTFSVPLKGNLTSPSGLSSPREQSCNTLSFDRDALMQTLASLPIIPVSSSASSSTSHDSCHSHLSGSTATHGDSVTFQNISSKTFVHSVSPCSSSSSSKPSSPVSFQPSIVSSSSNHAPTTETHDMQWQQIPSHGKDSKSTSGGELCNVSGTTNHFITSINNFVMTTPVLHATSPVGTGGVNLNHQVRRPWTSSDDARVLRQARAELDECGWYYGGLTWREAGSVLSGSSEGSFLVRDSWSGRCLYALSLQTARGPTSVRIEYESGKFRLESETAARDGVPHSSSVVALVQAYTQTTNPAHVWVDHSGQTVSAISVKKPLMKNPPTLQHLSRLAYNASPVKANLLDSRIPTLLRSYLESYPHTC